MLSTSRVLRKVKRTARFYLRMQEARRRGIVFVRPNYIFRDCFDQSSLIVDVGCGHEAEFSKHILQKYGSQVLGIDPTRKHEPFLRALQEQTQDRFRHLSFAVASTDGVVTFHESCENESGSILSDHTNVQTDNLKSYDVETVTLGSLPQRIGADRIDLIKLDLEGAEYELLQGTHEQQLTRYAQIFVEFHHHYVDGYSQQDTQSIVARLLAQGMTAFSLDDHNYLFYWE